jgi:hypothetical protein
MRNEVFYTKLRGVSYQQENLSKRPGWGWEGGRGKIKGKK